MMDDVWVNKAINEASAALLIHRESNSVAVDAAGKLKWASWDQVRLMADMGMAPDTILLGRRKVDAMPPSFLNARYSKLAQNTWCLGSAVDRDRALEVLGGGAQFVALRAAVGTLTAAEAAMAGQARQLLHWHLSHRFCGSCGGSTSLTTAGWKRRCTSCGRDHFPRTDPVVIAAILSPDGQRCLVGRQSTWPAGRVSCLAGFMDAGETLEEAVRREVREEAGVDVGAVIYHSSQPWPNGPSPQLMLGAVGLATSEELVVDTQELESARWLDLAEIAPALERSRHARDGTPNSTSNESGKLVLPEPVAIAHQLLATCAHMHRQYAVAIQR